jgi:hypothetical protein
VVAGYPGRVNQRPVCVTEGPVIGSRVPVRGALSWSFGEDGWFEVDLDGPDGPAAARVQLGNSALLLPDDPSWTGDGLKPAVRLVDIAGNAGPWSDLDLRGPVVRCVTAPSGCATVGAGPWWGMLGAAALIRRIARR